MTKYTRNQYLHDLKAILWLSLFGLLFLAALFFVESAVDRAWDSRVGDRSVNDSCAVVNPPAPCLSR